MTKPSDFSPRRVLEVQDSKVQTRSILRDLWLMRVAGAVLLVAGWLAVSVHQLWDLNVLVETGVFIVIGIYGYTAAERARRISVDLERKLRMSLLVHNMELANMAMQDDLTQLFNRRYFFERLERELQTARGFERPLSVILIDLNSMKSVNDTYGHRVGDKLLTGFGRFLLERTRASDVPARVGGDEFAILLPDTSEHAAQVLLGRLIQRLEETHLIEEDDVRLTLSASFGLSGFPWGGTTVDAILQKADAALYEAKRQYKSDAATVSAKSGNSSNGVPVTASPALKTDAS